MSTIVLDMGSGASCNNDCGMIREMIDAVAAIDQHKHLVYLKWQMFEDIPPNRHLSRHVFEYALGYAPGKGYHVGVSVFDAPSIDYVLSLRYRFPFIKVAARPGLYWIVGRVPRNQKVAVSVPPGEGLPMYFREGDVALACIPKYPARLFDYGVEDWKVSLHEGLSDHTVGWKLWERWHPEWYECHFKLPDAEGPDAGPWARTPQDLEAIL